MLIERDAQLRLIQRLLAGARSGQGDAVLVEGEPGIGKTSLLAAVQQEAADNRMAVLSARGGELEPDLAFSIVRQLFEPRLRAAPLAEHEELFADAAGHARPVFAGPSSGSAGAAAGPVVYGLYWLCANLADRLPLLVTVDDVHWADQASLRFLSHLARRIADLPALLVLAGRPPRPGEEGAAAQVFSGLSPHLMRLDPLSGDGVAALVRDTLPGDADDAFCTACADASGGNPFLLTEALTQLRAGDVEPVSGKVWRLSAMRNETISRSVLTRLARLGPDAVRLARAVAVLGPAAESRRVATLADVAPDRAVEVLDLLGHESVLKPVLPLEFAHPLIRTAVYLDASPAFRARAHKRAALLLAEEGVPPQLLAPQLLAAEPAADPWVVAALRAAAADAVLRGAPESAAACLRRALTEPPCLELRGPVLVELGRSLTMLSRPAEAAEALASGLALLESHRDSAEIGLELGMVYARSGQALKAIETFERLRGVTSSDDPDLPVRIQVGTALGSLMGLRPPSMWMAELERTASRLGGTEQLQRMVFATVAFGLATSGQRPHRDVIRLATMAAVGPLPDHEPWLLVNLAGAGLSIAGVDGAALQLVDRGIDEARRRGDVASFGYLSMLRSRTAFYAGNLAEAEADGRAALRVHEDRRDPDASLSAAVLVDALVERGDVDGAQQVLIACDLTVHRTLNWLIGHFVFMARARLRRHQQRPREALEDLYTCGDGLIGGGYTNPGFAQWRSEAVLAHLALDEHVAARRLAATDLDLARGFGAPRAIGIALRVAGLAEGGRAGLRLLEEAVAVLGGSTSHLEHGRALIDLGAALRRCGERVGARVPLRKGADLAARCGADPLVGRAHDELVAAGGRPRRVRLSGPESLTAGELRVARLIAAGSTNRQAAQRLFVTTRTVEVHLTSTYRKLGIASRSELRDALG